MTLEYALQAIRAPKGVTSLIAAAMANDLGPVMGPVRVQMTLVAAQEALADVQQKQLNSKSDWAWWGWAGDIAYWTCVVDLLKAADITGVDNLPDVPLPELGVTVMDAQAHIERWGRSVLQAAEESRKVSSNIAE